MIRFVCRPFPLFSDTIFLLPSFTPLFTPLHRSCSSFIPPFKTWSPLLASCCLFHSGLLALIHAVVCTLHSQDSFAATLRTDLHAGCGKQAAINPFLCFSSRLLTQNTFLTQAVVPVQEGFLFLFFNSCLTLLPQPTFHKSSNDREQTQKIISVYEQQTRAMLTLLQTLWASILPLYFINSLSVRTSSYTRWFLLLAFTFMPAAAAGPPGSTAWMWQGLLPRTTKPQPTASPTIWEQNNREKKGIWREADLWPWGCESIGRGVAYWGKKNKKMHILQFNPRVCAWELLFLVCVCSCLRWNDTLSSQPRGCAQRVNVAGGGFKVCDSTLVSAHSCLFARSKKSVRAYSESLLQERSSWRLQLLWTHLSFQDCWKKHTQTHDWRRWKLHTRIQQVYPQKSRIQIEHWRGLEARHFLKN